MGDGKDPEIAANLFVCETRSCHLEDGAPGAFHKAVARLAACGCGNDAGVVVIDPFESFSAN